MNQKKILITVYTLVLLTTFFFIGCNKKQRQSEYTELFTVKPVDLSDIITQTGEVRPYVKLDLKSEASGRIKKVYVKEGQRVEKGQKIVDIDPTRLLYQKERLDLTLKKAQIEKNLTKRDFDNAVKLQKTGTVSSKSISDLKSKYQLAEISYNQHQLELNDLTD
ncbi:MAG: biotin/lipoyl-binding protein, partial [Chitinispirillia bacterium]